MDSLFHSSSAADEASAETRFMQQPRKEPRSTINDISTLYIFLSNSIGSAKHKFPSTTHENAAIFFPRFLFHADLRDDILQRGAVTTNVYKTVRQFLALNSDIHSLRVPSDTANTFSLAIDQFLPGTSVVAGPGRSFNPYAETDRAWYEAHSSEPATPQSEEEPPNMVSIDETFFEEDNWFDEIQSDDKDQ